MRTLKHEDLSKKIIAAACNVHKELGHGFLEKVYRNALAVELEEAGLTYALEAPLQVTYHGRIVGDYFADLIVDDKNRCRDQGRKQNSTSSRGATCNLPKGDRHKCWPSNKFRSFSRNKAAYLRF